MTTTKSYSKNHDRFGSAYMAALKAQFPFAIVSGIIFLILFVVVFFVSALMDQHGPIYAGEFFKNYFKQGIYADISQSMISLVILAVIALASTLVGLSYLHSKKTVDLYHSLPVTRPKLLAANLLATLTAALGPFLAMYLLTMAIQLVTCARYNCFNADYFVFILFDIAAAVIYTTVITAFVAFVAVNVGTVFDAFAVTMAVGFAPPIIYLLSGAIWQSILYGAMFEQGTIWICLSPFMFIFMIFAHIDGGYSADSVSIARDYGSAMPVLLFGLLAAALLAVAAVVCYRRRKSEIAEQTQPRGVLQIIVKLVASFIGGAVFFAIFDGYNGVNVIRLLMVLIGSVSIGLIAEIILSRGVRWVPKNLKWLLGAGVVYCLLLVGLQADIFGYTARIPAMDSIESVQISYSGRFSETDSHPYRYDYQSSKQPLTDATSIAVVRDMHSIAVSNRPPQAGGVDDMEFDYTNINIEYQLKNGSTMRRTYSPIHSLALEKLAGLENHEDFIRANSTLFWAEQNPKLAKVETVELYASIGGKSGKHVNVLEDPELLLNAIRADMLEQSLEDILNPQSPALGFIKVQFRAFEAGYTGYYYEQPYAIVTVTQEYKRTIEVLKKLKLDGDFTGEALKYDDIVRVGLVPTWGRDYYGSGRVRSFNPWLMSEDMISPWTLSQQYSKDRNYAYNIFVTRTDAAGIRAIAQVSKDSLFVPARGNWHRNYAIVYFEMADGSVLMKALKLDDLPPDIRAEALENAPELYSYNTSTVYEPEMVTSTEVIVVS